MILSRSLSLGALRLALAGLQRLGIRTCESLDIFVGPLPSHCAVGRAFLPRPAEYTGCIRHGRERRIEMLNKFTPEARFSDKRSGELGVRRLLT